MIWFLSVIQNVTHYFTNTFVKGALKVRDMYKVRSIKLFYKSNPDLYLIHGKLVLQFYKYNFNFKQGRRKFVIHWPNLANRREHNSLFHKRLWKKHIEVVKMYKIVLDM